MRQRGAGNRQINNVDFGFAFSTPSQLRRSRTRSKTPQTASQIVRHSTRTSTRSETEGPQPVLPSATRVELASDTTKSPARKRRRLSELSNLTRATSVELPFSSEAVGIVHEEGDLLVEAPNQLHTVHEEAYENQEHAVPSSPLFISAESANKENGVATSLSSKPALKRRKRKSIGQQSMRKKKRNSGASGMQVPTPLDTHESVTAGDNDILVDDDDGMNPTDLTSPATNNVSRQASKLASPLSIQSQEQPETTLLDTTKPKRRKKRTSITFKKNKRRSSDLTSRIYTPPDESIVETIEDQESVDRLDPYHGTVLSSEPNDAQPHSSRRGRSNTNPVPGLPPNRFINAEAQLEHAASDSEASDQDYHPDEGTPEPTPAPNRKKATLTQQRKRPTKTKSNVTVPQKASQRGKSTFPVLTHRMTNVQHLPTITEVSEGEDVDADELALPPTFTTRQTPNAVDVLAQICRETVDSALENLRTQPHIDGTSRPIPKQKTSALEVFRTNLDSRLFDVSQSLDQRLQLETRLRKSRRDKAEVQARWLELRERRDQIALRADEIRKQHWESEAIARRAWQASESAGKVEAELQRAEEGEEDEVGDSGRLEVMMRTLVGDVSSVDGGGVLRTLKGFNERLERLATVLEGR